MDLNYVKKLIKLLSESDVEELEIEEEGKKIRLTKARPASAPTALAPPPMAAYSVPQAVPAAPSAAPTGGGSRAGRCASPRSQVAHRRYVLSRSRPRRRAVCSDRRRR